MYEVELVGGPRDGEKRKMNYLSEVLEIPVPPHFSVLAPSEVMPIESSLRTECYKLGRDSRTQALRYFHIK